MLGLDRDVEGVRLGDDRVAAQVVAFRSERDHVGPPTEPAELDLEGDVGRWDGLPALARPGPVLGRHAALEDGELELEVAGGEQAPPMRALGCLLRCSVAFPMTVDAARMGV